MEEGRVRQEEVISSQTEAKRKPFAVHAARWSLIAPAIAIVCGLVVERLVPVLHPAARPVSMILVSLFVIGLVLAIVALAGMRKHGRKGIFGKALVGVIINGLILTLMAALVPPLMKIKAGLGPLSTERLQAMPTVFDGYTVVIDKELGFRMEIPPEFQEYPNQQGMKLPVIHTFARELDGGTVQAIQVNRLPGVIGTEEFSDIDVVKRTLPPGASVIHKSEQWGQYRVDSFVLIIPNGQTESTVLMAQVPLVMNAVQIIVTCPDGERENGRELLRKLLSGLKGRCSWDYGIPEDTRGRY